MKFIVIFWYYVLAVMGDAEVTLAEYPFIVLIKLTSGGNTTLITGSLISLKAVLSASQDLFNLRNKYLEPGTVKVYANISTYEDLSSAHVRDVSIIKTEPSQRADDYYPLLVMLLLSEPFIKVSNQIETIQINKGRLDWTCVLVGWGYDSLYSNVFVPQAWYKKSIPYTAKQCESQFVLAEFDSQMCIKTSTRTNWTATIGSPLLCGGALTGLKYLDTYFTDGTFRVSVFVRLRNYLFWIEWNTPDLPPVVSVNSGIEDDDEDYKERYKFEPSQPYLKDDEESYASKANPSTFFIYINIFMFNIIYYR
uniref:Peptidase S1 domain-containing protein n=2 Tax=Clastoptera arizonana TaxID=38151 RepID=A0A1B6E7Y4_9HEMI